MELEPRDYFLPRLPREFYQGDAVVHWTLSVFDQESGWLKDSFHQHFRELMLHTAAREGLFCPTYCLMPDHIHLVWMGLRFDTDQRNGMAFLRTHLKRPLAPHKFQPQAHDRVLSEKEWTRNAFAKVCFYILNNPMKAGLAGAAKDWCYLGAIVPGYPDLHPLDQDYWPMFWKLYSQARDIEAGNRILPPRASS